MAIDSIWLIPAFILGAMYGALVLHLARCPHDAFSVVASNEGWEISCTHCGKTWVQQGEWTCMEGQVLEVAHPAQVPTAGECQRCAEEGCQGWCPCGCHEVHG